MTNKWVTGSRDRQLNRRRNLSQSTKLPLWTRQIKSGSIKYYLNKENPLYIWAIKDLSNAQITRLEEYINAIQSAMPINSIFDDIKEDSSSIEQEEIDERLLLQHAQPYLGFLREKGLEKDECLRILSRTELYRLKWSDIREKLE